MYFIASRVSGIRIRRLFVPKILARHSVDNLPLTVQIDLDSFGLRFYSLSLLILLLNRSFAFWESWMRRFWAVLYSLLEIGFLIISVLLSK